MIIKKKIYENIKFWHTFDTQSNHFLEHKDKNRLLHFEVISMGMILEAYISTQVCGFHSTRHWILKRRLINTSQK